MMSLQRWILLAAIGLVPLSGCQSTSPTVAYYTLTALQKPPADPARPLPLTIGIGPLVLPAYLDRLQIVTRPAPTRLTVNDYQRWAGPLQKDIGRVLGENLKLLTGSPRVVAFPWSAGQRPDIAVSLTIDAFEGIAGDRVLLRATVTLRDLRSSATPQQSWEFQSEQPAVLTDFEVLTAAQSRALTELSRDIAARLQHL